MNWLAQYRKAIVSAFSAASAVAVTAVADDVITAGEWVGIIAAGLAALGITWAVPNSAPPSEPQGPRRVV